MQYKQQILRFIQQNIFGLLVICSPVALSCQNLNTAQPAQAPASGPKRIVTLTPALTEIVFALGAGDKIVGNTTYCDYPAAATGKAKVGGAVPNSLNVERVVSLKPDLILLSALGQEPLVAQLRQLRLPVTFLQTVNVEDVFTTIASVGALLGREQQAERLIELNRRLFAETKARIAGRPRPKVFHLIWQEPLMTAGPTSFLGQVLATGGGDNIFSDLTMDYPQVSHEQIVQRNPDVILGPEYEFKALTPEMLNSAPGWRSIKAVKTGRIYLLEDQIVSRPGPRIGLAVVLVAKALYPDVDFSDLEKIGRAILPPN